MRVTEEMIRAALDGHFYAVHWDGRIVDRAVSSDDGPKQPRPWTKQDLRQLLTLKRKGYAIESIEVEMNRDRRSISDVWIRRDQWLPEVEDKVIPPAPVVARLDGPLEPIRQTVCAAYGISKEQFRSASRNHRLVEARQVFFWICWKFTAKSFSHIGRLVSRDHSTVMYGASRIDMQFEKYRPVIERCISALGLTLPEQGREAA